jgi:tetratricopeptide (TPR) repeat protein
VDHPDTLTSVGNLGSLLNAQGKLEEAEVLSRRALEGSERVLGVDHPDTLNSAFCLGSLLYKQGKLEESVSLLRRALEGYERVLGPEHPSTQKVAGWLKGVTSQLK